MANIDRGQYSKRVTFRNYPTADDDAGGETESAPVNFLTTYANVKPGRANRVFETGEDMMIKRKTIRVFSRALLTANLKKETHIIYDGIEYSIEDFGPDEEDKRVIKIEAIGA